MLTFDDVKLEFSYMGLFSTDDTWIHPDRTEVTYEIIYVVSGDVYIESAGQRFHLKKKDIIILPPDVRHFGYKSNTGNTKFYWVHFFMTNFDSLLKHSYILNNFTHASLFRELLHYNNIPNKFLPIKSYADCLLAHIIAEISYSMNNSTESGKLPVSIYEYIRVNISSKLTVSDIAKHFGYNPEYISRITKQAYGYSLKQMILITLTQKAKDLLVNTNLSIKEIASQLQFATDNAFIGFFKYHEQISPSKYRNKYVYTHMNKK